MEHGRGSSQQWTGERYIGVCGRTGDYLSSCRRGPKWHLSAVAGPVLHSTSSGRALVSFCINAGPPFLYISRGEHLVLALSSLPQKSPWTAVHIAGFNNIEVERLSRHRVKNPCWL